MGSINFKLWAKGDSVVEAYDLEVYTANWQHGHNPYNGTISTTDRVLLNDPAPGVTTDQELEQYIEDNFEELHRACTKWGICRAFASPEHENHWLIYGWAAI